MDRWMGRKLLTVWPTRCEGRCCAACRLLLPAAAGAVAALLFASCRTRASAMLVVLLSAFFMLLGCCCCCCRGQPCSVLPTANQVAAPWRTLGTCCRCPTHSTAPPLALAPPLHSSLTLVPAWQYDSLINVDETFMGLKLMRRWLMRHAEASQGRQPPVYCG